MKGVELVGFNLEQVIVRAGELMREALAGDKKVDSETWDLIQARLKLYVEGLLTEGGENFFAAGPYKQAMAKAIAGVLVDRSRTSGLFLPASGEFWNHQMRILRQSAHSAFRNEAHLLLIEATDKGVPFVNNLFGG